MPLVPPLGMFYVPPNLQLVANTVVTISHCYLLLCEGSTFAGRRVGVNVGVKRARADTMTSFACVFALQKGVKKERMRRDSNPRFPG